MKKFLVVSDDLVWVDDARIGHDNLVTFDRLRELVPRKGPVLFAVLPKAVTRIFATERTIDSAVATQFAGNNSVRAEALGPNLYQVLVVDDEFLGRLRELSSEAMIVPYPIAVRHAIRAPVTTDSTSVRDRTRLFLSMVTQTGAPSQTERIVVDVFADGHLLMIAFRGKEVLATRHVRGGDIFLELQRTLASARLESATVYSTNRDLANEFKAHGYAAEHVDEPGDPPLGMPQADKVTSLRFLSAVEIAREHASKKRQRALLATAVSVGLCALAGGAFAFTKVAQARAERDGSELQQQQQAKAAELAALNMERYASTAAKESVRVSEELFDLLVSLPPQVALVSLEHDQRSLLATIERRPQAAPFSRSDLQAALAASPFFAKAKIDEEYDGHLVRYLLTVPVPPAAATAPARP